VNEVDLCVQAPAGKALRRTCLERRHNNAFKLTSADGWSPSGTTRWRRSQLNAMFCGLPGHPQWAP
jgi:hypothetical protein